MFRSLPSRRRFLRSLVGGSLALPGILSELLAADARSADPLAPKKPHHAAEGEARHLPVLHRRRVAHGHVRPQAEAVRGRRQDDSASAAGCRSSSGRCCSRAGSSSPAASAARWSATCSRTSASRWTTSA